MPGLDWHRKGTTMRAFFSLTTLTLSLMLVEPALAQQQPVFFGPQPLHIVNKPVDTSTAVGNFHVNQNAFRAPRAPGTFTVSNFFPKISLGSWPPKIAKAPSFPSPPPAAKTNSPMNTNLLPTPGR
jgi:hypothetical protein